MLAWFRPLVAQFGGGQLALQQCAVALQRLQLGSGDGYLLDRLWVQTIALSAAALAARAFAAALDAAHIAAITKLTRYAGLWCLLTIRSAKLAPCRPDLSRPHHNPHDRDAHPKSEPASEVVHEQMLLAYEFITSEA